MRSVQMIVSAGIYLGGALCSGASKADLICIHPIPLTIKELVEKQKSGLISEELLKRNAEYLVLKYCAATADRIPAVSSVALGDGCEMKWGDRLGERVYWATCNTTDENVEADKNKATSTLTLPVPRPSSPRRPETRVTFEQNLQCCVRHWTSRQGGSVAPEGQSTSNYKSRSDLLLTCQMGLPQNAWAGYLETLGGKDFCAIR
ncbi:hypothetical protein [Bradyrhizobium icense]|uniref:hypothetical protein n=1 Tax=Bradyrhizobium icense TaxID=1274631 RepID=UPI0012EA9A1B|nr:hypothetical protein [Bradyrhizobium icense]